MYADLVNNRFCGYFRCTSYETILGMLLLSIFGAAGLLGCGMAALMSGVTHNPHLFFDSLSDTDNIIIGSVFVGLAIIITLSAVIIYFRIARVLKQNIEQDEEQDEEQGGYSVNDI